MNDNYMDQRSLILRITFKDDRNLPDAARAISDHLTETFNDDNTIAAVEVVHVDWVVTEVLWND